MKNNLQKVLSAALVLCVALLCTTNQAHAQGDLDGFLSASTADAESGVSSYMEPVLKGFGYALNAGWYNTAKPHKTLGFDITITTALAFVPDKDLAFTFLNSNYESIRLTGGQTETELPTIFGASTSQPIEVYDPATGVSLGTFDSPEGIDLDDEIGSFVPLPMIQAGIGIVKDTEIRVRYLPTIDIEDGEINLFGIGIMHGVKQYIPGMKNVPIDISVFVGYTQLSTNYDVDGTFDNLGTQQIAEFDVNGLTIEALASKKFSVLTVYGSLGFNRAGSSFAFKGTYDLDENGSVSDNEVDPLDIDISDTSVRALVGARLKLGVFTLHGDYTLNGYNTFTGGIGLSFR